MKHHVHSEDLAAGTLAVLCFLATLQLGAVFSAAPLAAAAGVVVAGIPLALYIRDRRATGTAPAARDVSPRFALILLAVVVLAALVLRLHTLMERPAWDDEMWTLRNMYTSDWGELFRVAFDDYWPPLHYMLLNTVARIANTEILWLRLPSVVFGVATVAAMYPLGLLLFRSRIPALIGCTMLAGMTTHVLFSQEARVYAMQMFFVVLSAHFFYQSYWERRISPAFLLAATALTYSHSFSSWYFIASLAAYVVVAWLIWRDRLAFRRGFVSQVLVFLLWLPLVAAFAWSRFRHDIVVPTYWATGAERFPSPLDLIEQYQGLGVRSWVGAGALVLLYGLAVWLAWRQYRGSRDATEALPLASRSHARVVVFLLCWILVPVLFSLIVSTSTSMKTFGAIRYHLAVVPALCLLGAAGFAALRSRASLVLAAALVVLVPSAELPRYYREFSHGREAHHVAASIVRTTGAADERIYVGNGYRVFSYYFKGIFPRIGSAQWDSLTAAHAHLTDRSTLDSPKWGDTHAYEKQSPRIAFYGYYPLDPSAEPGARYERFIQDELARGGFRGTYWLVLDERGLQSFLPELEEAGVSCRAPDVWMLQGLEVRRCNPPDTAAPTDAEPSDPVTRLQKSEENTGSRIASSVGHSG